MEQQKRIDKILSAVETRVQDEVGALLGAEFVLDSGTRKLVSKAELFEGLTGKQIFVHLEISGEVSGAAGLLIGIKDAIRLGGTLIMLPDNELQEVIGREEYREEVEDSFGEIANIIAGTITKDFEEMYPKPCRFIRKGQEIVVPAKVDIESDQPIADKLFYLSAFPMFLEEKQLGQMVLILPAESFGLEKEATKRNAAAEPAEQQEAQAAASQAEPVKATRQAPKLDFEKQRKRIDQLLTECQKRLTTEISALLGVDIFLDDLDNQIISKEQFFTGHAAGKQVLTEMEVVGDLQDTCYFAIGLKDAIHLGGVLIMLPPSELTNVINEEDFSDDTTDAYGEVANIVSGVYTAVFEEQYSKKLRFIKKQLKMVVPLKVETASNDPFPDKLYYSSRMSLSVEGKGLGNMHMLFPLELLQLEMPQSKAEQTQVAAEDLKTEAVAQKTPPPEIPRPEESVKIEKKTAPVKSEVKEALDKQRKRVDKLLILCCEKIQNEVSALLGLNVQLSNQTNKIISKEFFFGEFVSGKQVIANMNVVGDLTGESCLVINLRDAIRIGGALIMLPNSELESVVADEEFGDDTKDAFGEIANIVAGVYTSVFEEQYTKKLRFIKTDLHQVVPMKVELESDEPFPNDDYYVSSMDLSIDDMNLGKVNVVFPLELLQLEGLRTKPEAVAEEVVETARQPETPHVAEEIPVSPDILLIGDDETEAGKIGSVLKGMGYSVKSLSFKDNVHNYIPGQLKAIYLVMRDVNEQTFGIAIKVSAASSLPLIAAGPGWTKTKVIKAVKYGVRDILLTPASQEDIEENVTNNLLRLAA